MAISYLGSQMRTLRPWFLLLAATVAAVAEPQAQSYTSHPFTLTEIVSFPASLSTELSELNSYLSQVITGAGFSEATSYVREFAEPDIGLDILQGLDEQGTNPAAAYTVPSAVSAFINSVASVEDSILHTTLADSQVASLTSRFGAEFSEINSYRSQLAADPAVSSILSGLPYGFIDPGYLAELRPLFEDFDNGLPDNVKAFISSVISREDVIQRYTATELYLSGYSVPFPSTTITAGTYFATVAATTGASVQSTGPAATGTSSSSSSAAAPTSLGCGGSCGAMLGAMLGVAVGAIAL